MEPPQKPTETQQTSTVTVAIVKTQRPVAQFPYWQSSICGCFANCGVLCQTYCCFFCTLSNVLTKLETGIPSCNCCSCCIMCCMDPCMMLLGVRRELVERYNMQDESVCKTCMCAWCCYCCAWCQVQNEMILRGDGAGGCCAAGHVAQAPQADGMGAQAIKMNYGGHQPGNWGSGLCGCAGCGDCLENWCCPCCVQGYVVGKVDSLRIPGQEGNQGCSCCALLCSLCAPAHYVFMNRREMIERYHIQGEGHIRSCCCAYCCLPCAAGQQRREMGYRGEWPGGLCVKEAPTQKP